MKLIARIKSIVLNALSHAPRALPSGVTEFNAMAARVCALAGNICTLDDARFVISTTVMRFDPDVSRATDRKFVKILRNAAAKQVSACIFQYIKIKQAEAALAQQTAEATAQTTAAPDGEETSDPK